MLIVEVLQKKNLPLTLSSGIISPDWAQAFFRKNFSSYAQQAISVKQMNVYFHPNKRVIKLM